MSPNHRISVLCVDDHPLFLEGLSAVIRCQQDMTLLALALTGAQGVALALEHKPDITLMDLRLPDMSGIRALSSILSSMPRARVIMLTTFEGDVEVQRAMAAGARAYMLKSSALQEIVLIIREVFQGKYYLPSELAARVAKHLSDEAVTSREVEVLKLVAAGNRNRDIAAELLISEDTVKGHVRHIMEKLGAKDRTEAVAIGLKRGIIHL